MRLRRVVSIGVVAALAGAAWGQTAVFAPMSRDLSDVAFGKTKLTAYSVTVMGSADVALARVLAQTPSLAVVPRPLALAALARSQRVSKPHLAVKVAKEAALLGLGLLASGTIHAEGKWGTALVTAFTTTQKAADSMDGVLDWGQIDRYQQMACADVIKVEAGASAPCIVLVSKGGGKAVTVELK